MAHDTTYDASRSVAFLHVPKSAGTAVAAAVARALGQDAPGGQIDRCMFGSFDRFNELPPVARQLIILDAHSVPRNRELLSGHISLSVISAARPDAQILTIFREPVSRLLSLWLYWRSIPRDFHDVWGSWSDVIRLSHRPLRDFLHARQAACQTDNQALRLLLWPHPLIPDDDFIDTRHDVALVDAALATLARFSFIDVVENPGMARNLGSWLGRRVALERINETGTLPRALRPSMTAELDPVTVDRLAWLSRLDTLLWEAAVGLAMPDANPRTLRAATIGKKLASCPR